MGGWITVIPISVQVSSPSIHLYSTVTLWDTFVQCQIHLHVQVRWMSTNMTEYLVTVTGT